MDLFFVLSGFLITGILLRTKNAPRSVYLKSFFARRMLRIFPIYYLMLTALVIATPYLGQHGLYGPPHPWTYYLYLTNWVDPYTAGTRTQMAGHLWTLAVEEQFYVIWPFCVLAFSAKILYRLCALGILGALALRCFCVAEWGPSEFVYKNLLTRMDTLLIGALCALLVHQGLLEPYAHLLRLFPALGSTLIGGCLTCLAVAHHLVQSHLDIFMQTVGYTLLACGFAVLLLYSVARDVPVLCFRSLTTVGRYSYGLYLYHVPLFVLLGYLMYRFLPVSLSHSSKGSLLYVAVPLLASLFLAWLSFTYLETPILRLRSQFTAREVTVMYSE